MFLNSVRPIDPTTDRCQVSWLKSTTGINQPTWKCKQNKMYPTYVNVILLSKHQTDQVNCDTLLQISNVWVDRCIEFVVQTCTRENTRQTGTTTTSLLAWSQNNYELRYWTYPSFSSIYGAASCAQFGLVLTDISFSQDIGRFCIFQEFLLRKYVLEVSICLSDISCRRLILCFYHMRRVHIV